MDNWRLMASFIFLLRCLHLFFCILKALVFFLPAENFTVTIKFSMVTNWKSCFVFENEHQTEKCSKSSPLWRFSIGFLFHTIYKYSTQYIQDRQKNWQGNNLLNFVLYLQVSSKGKRERRKVSFFNFCNMLARVSLGKNKIQIIFSGNVVFDSDFFLGG